MAKLTQNFADEEKFIRDLDANCRHHGYPETIMDENGVEIPNDKTKQDFMEQTLKRIFKEASKAQRTQEALKALVIED